MNAQTTRMLRQVAVRTASPRLRRRRPKQRCQTSPFTVLLCSTQSCFRTTLSAEWFRSRRKFSFQPRHVRRSTLALDLGHLTFFRGSIRPLGKRVFALLVQYALRSKPHRTLVASCGSLVEDTHGKFGPQHMIIDIFYIPRAPV